MARRLPWKKTEHTEGVKSASLRSSNSANGQVSTTRTPESRLRRVAKLSSTRVRRARSQSESPPPESPPRERFMIPGPSNDDKYRMVEDEFLETAHLFTAHLHRAEYSRLETLAKSHNAETIRHLERPVVGPPNREVRHHTEEIQRRAKQRKFLQQQQQDKGDEIDDTESSRNLHGLMETPRRDSKALNVSHASRMGTRAPLGFSSAGESSALSSRIMLGGKVSSSSFQGRDDGQRQGPTQDADLNLDGDSHNNSKSSRATPDTKGKSALPIEKQESPPTSCSKSVAFAPSSLSSPAPKPTPRERSGASIKSSTSSPVVAVQSSDDHDDDPFGINKRRLQRKSRESLRKSAEKRRTPQRPAPDVMPSFL